MPFLLVSLGLGGASLIYLGLNIQLFRGLGNLARSKNGFSVKKIEAKAASTHPLVTILIAARNEEFRISKCLDCLMTQDYPAEYLQIIIVNDRSEDKTAEILNRFAVAWPGRLTLLTVSQSSPGLSPKKFALRLGMEKATGEIIVTTDADCIMSKSWVSTLVAEFEEKTGLVLGMTSYYPMGSKNIAWGTQALEFISYGVVAAGLVGLRFPVHGNANNIAYRRRAYEEASGFSTHGNIVSGDDDFLIQSIHKLGRWDIRYCVQKESQVRTEPPLSWGQFWEQRKRWASKCSLYQPKQAAFLGAIFIYYALIPLCIISGFFDARFLILGLACWLVKIGSDFGVMFKGLSVFSQKDLLRWFIPTSIIHIPLILAAVFAGTFGDFIWKGQKVRRKV